MKTELRLTIKDDSNRRPLNMFLDSWLEGMCGDRYLLTENTVIFDYPEDAVIARLTNIPPMLSPYVGFDDTLE